MLELIKQPWHWSVAGVIIGLTVPALLLLGNKKFGISSSLRHICAACFPGNVTFFKYNWKKEMWNLFFAAGIIIGAVIASTVLHDGSEVAIADATREVMAGYGITNFQQLLPTEIFNWQNVMSLTGLLFFILGGFLVGFGTRYAGGCTSGHTIMGLSTLQWPSLVATISFMVGGLISTHYILPIIFNAIN